MKTRDEIINDLLETIDTMVETVEDVSIDETDFATLVPFVEQLREEVVSLSEAE